MPANNLTENYCDVVALCNIAKLIPEKLMQPDYSAAEVKSPPLVGCVYIRVYAHAHFNYRINWDVFEGWHYKKWVDNFTFFSLPSI